MRVLVLATTFPRRPHDTVPHFVYDLALALARRGHDMYVIAPHDAGASLRERMGPLEVERFPYFRPQRLQVLAYGGGILDNFRRRPLARLQAPLLLSAMTRAARRAARRWKPDVLHSHWLIPAGYAASRVAARTGIPHVATAHAGDVVGLSRLPFGSRVLARTLRHTDHLVPVSGFVEERIARILKLTEVPIRSTVLTMGVDVATVRAFPRHEPSAPTILFVGRLVEKKGVAILLQAFAAVRHAVPEARLVVCGSGPDRERLEGLAATLGPHAVEFRGFVTDEEKRMLLRSCEALVVPSVQASSGDVEGMPVVILEGLAAGVPIVATSTGGVRDVLRHGQNGLLVPPGDADALASALVALLRDPAHRRRLAEAAAADAPAYDWDKIALAYEQILTAVSPARGGS